MTPTIYITVPVEVKPEKEGEYMCIDTCGHGSMVHLFANDPFPFPNQYTHYLRPATRADLINLLREDLEKAMGEVYTAGSNWQSYHQKILRGRKATFTIPDRSTSINNAIQKLIG